MQFWVLSAVSAVLKRARPASLMHPEGRWSLIPWGRPDAAAHAIFAAELLLQRYGIVARELSLKQTKDLINDIYASPAPIVKRASEVLQGAPSP